MNQLFHLNDVAVAIKLTRKAETRIFCLRATNCRKLFRNFITLNLGSNPLNQRTLEVIIINTWDGIQMQLAMRGRIYKYCGERDSFTKSTIREA